jgi:hypothetical protein
MPTKLKIKMGHIEFEYEGDAPYDTESVKDLFTHLETLMGAAPPGAFDAPPPPPPSNGADPDNSASSDFGNLAPSSVAARLDAKTGTEVAIAAAAHLQICLGQDTFNRRDLLKTMQAKTGYYKASMGSNLIATLKSLVKAKRINSLTGDQMSLSAGEIASLRAKLAQS